MKKETGIIVVLAALVVGFGVGYTVNTGGRSGEVGRMNNGSHMMPDGRMMDGNGDMSMASMMDVMNAELKGKKGDEFDKSFLSEMIVHHQGAVEMAELAIVNAKHQEIKDLAAGIIKAQENEISQMKAWQIGWYK
jgi:uncharacterized protein (DUF305 family)